MTDTTLTPPAPDAEHRFPCDTCGADMRFSPQTGQMVCDFCGNTEQVADPATPHPMRELDFRRAVAQQLPQTEMEETRVASCPNCGAQVEFDPAVHATECPFCATPVVADTGVHRHIKPAGLVPFVLDEPAAHKAMSDWLGSLWFAPNGLSAYARKGRKMSGIYVPYWTFDADTRSRYTGQRGTVYYESRRVVRNGKSQTVQVQKVRWRSVSGRVARFFDDVLVMASTSLPRPYVEALEPWELGQLVPYSPAFLAGFRAEAYQVELDEGFDHARVKMDAVIARDVRFDIGGDRQRISSIDTDVSDVTFKHILLPVWMAAYKYRGETYRFVVNGQSGRVQGERPWSWIKITLAVIAALIVAGIAAYVYQTTQG
ncbi:primosomal protein N' (replication factor Y) - superfamily II helicase [Rhodobacteraceae bacterium CCMM004]|nr:primosomal protein N' (replication factor Y) - superfamily II helicase [Rhodobacteraceae bacterium CCMM004]